MPTFAKAPVSRVRMPAAGVKKTIAGMNDPEKPATAAPKQTGMDN